MARIVDSLFPYEFSPTVLLICCLSGIFFLRGQSVAEVRSGRIWAFWLGLVLIYVVLQTRVDFYAQHMFFLHRLQHLVLHHLAPFLIAWSTPREVLFAGMSLFLRNLSQSLSKNRFLGAFYRAIQQPVVSTILFVAIIYLWLIPNIHFYAMLNLPLYNLMNWGMAVDGLLFWWMVFNRRAPGISDARHYGGRIVLLFLAMFPQILIGSYIALSRQDLYDVYAVCGRAWPLTSQVDQQIGGLITWIPAAMMSIVGMLVLLRRWQFEPSGEKIC